MGVRDQSRRPLGRSTSPPHCPTDPWARAHTDRPTCRFRGLCLNHATRQHACRAPCGNSGLRGLSRCWVCRRGIREMALGTESADPRGSCHQPRLYHVSPATHCSAGLSSVGGARRAAIVESTRFSLLRRSLWISSMYYTHAPQLFHASPPTRAFSHMQDAPAAPSPHAPRTHEHSS